MSTELQERLTEAALTPVCPLDLDAVLRLGRRRRRTRAVLVQAGAAAIVTVAVAVAAGPLSDGGTLLLGGAADGGQARGGVAHGVGPGDGGGDTVPWLTAGPGETVHVTGEQLDLLRLLAAPRHSDGWTAGVRTLVPADATTGDFFTAMGPEGHALVGLPGGLALVEAGAAQHAVRTDLEILEAAWVPEGHWVLLGRVRGGDGPEPALPLVVARVEPTGDYRRGPEVASDPGRVTTFIEAGDGEAAILIGPEGHDMGWRIAILVDAKGVGVSAGADLSTAVEATALEIDGPVHPLGPSEDGGRARFDLPLPEGGHVTVLIEDPAGEAYRHARFAPDGSLWWLVLDGQGYEFTRLTPPRDQ